MGMKTFAAIDIGSYHVRMDIYEMSQQTGIRHIDTVQSRLEMGKETYSDRTITVDTAKELCRILKNFTEIMKEYQVEDYRVCATSTLGEAKNVWMVPVSYTHLDVYKRQL